MYNTYNVYDIYNIYNIYDIYTILICSLRSHLTYVGLFCGNTGVFYGYIGLICDILSSFAEI